MCLSRVWHVLYSYTLYKMLYELTNDKWIPVVPRFLLQALIADRLIRNDNCIVNDIL